MDDVQTALAVTLDAREAAKIGSLLVVSEHHAGTQLISVGSVPALSLVVDGLVTVTDGPHELAQLGPGSWFGELGWLNDRAAMAEVVAATDVVVASAPAKVADRLRASSGLMTHLEQVAATRSATNRAIDVAPLVLDGRHAGLVLRPMWPDDWRLFEAGTERVSAESLRLRFFSTPKITNRFLRRMTAVDFTAHFAWVVLHDGALVAVGRHAPDREHDDTAEIALLVADDWQGQGIGSLLVTALAAAADVQGFESFIAFSLADNRSVQRLLERFGASFAWGGVTGEVESTWPVSVACERVDQVALFTSARTLAEEVLRGLGNVPSSEIS